MSRRSRQTRILYAYAIEKKISNTFETYRVECYWSLRTYAGYVRVYRYNLLLIGLQPC